MATVRPAEPDLQRESRVRLDAILRAAGMVAWEWDVERNEVHHLGDIGALAGSAWGPTDRLFHFIHPEDRERVAESLQQAWAEDVEHRQEFRVVRPAGEVRWVADVGRASVFPDGRRWLSGVLTDITARKVAEDAAQQSRARLDFALGAAGMTAWDWDSETGMVLHTADLNFNLSTEIENRSQFMELMHPEDRPRVAQAFEAAFLNGGDYRQEYRIRRPEGGWHWISSTGRALTDPDGRRRMSGVMADVTGRKTAEVHRNLLINELNHRVKNTLAVIQGVAAQTFRGRDDEAARIFQGRLLALSTAHNVLTRENWESAGMKGIIEDAVRPFATGEADRIRLSGPDIRVPPKTAVAIAMAIHELGSNAVKYGALSNAEGRVELQWSGDGDRLRLKWRESGGPPVVEPTRRGFGSRMIERGLAAELGGMVNVLFRPEGVSCEVDAPLPRPENPDSESDA